MSDQSKNLLIVLGVVLGVLLLIRGCSTREIKIKQKGNDRKSETKIEIEKDPYERRRD